MNTNTKILIVIAGLMVTIATAATLWQADKVEEDATWERATAPRESQPSSQRPITSDDLFGSGAGEDGQ